MQALEQPHVAAVVVSYGATKALAECLSSLQEASVVRTIVVVDNKRDPSLRDLVEGSRAHLLEPGFNLGYGRAVNFAAEALGQEFDVLAIVNPDVTVGDGLKAAVRLVYETDAPVVSGRLSDHSGRPAQNWRRLPSLRRELGTAFRGSRIYRDSREWTQPHEMVEQADGALLLLKRESWEKLGGFDPRFELYYEDVDLCRRANDLGGVAMTRDVVGVHVGGESFVRCMGPAYLALRVSRHRYFRKWYGASGAAIALIATVLEFATRALARLPEGFAPRWRAITAEVRELRRPGSFVALEGGLSAADWSTRAGHSHGALLAGE
jgi:N-acetylglucosaminyl-diphospho-decaprenol L-rhamnosyltransferase